MDNNNNAEYINSVADGESIPCPECGAKNKTENEFCFSCGARLSSGKEEPASVPAFQTCSDDKDEEVTTGQYVEPAKVFAEGLPSWSIEPPQVMVRRH